MSGIGRQSERRYPFVLHCHPIFDLQNHSVAQFGTVVNGLNDSPAKKKNFSIDRHPDFLIDISEDAPNVKYLNSKDHQDETIQGICNFFVVAVGLFLKSKRKSKKK